MPNILSTDQSQIKFGTCDLQKQKKIIFEGSTLKIISGANTLYALDLSNFGQFGSEFGGSFKKDVYIPSQQTYTLFGGNVAQEQGEVSMIIVMVNYDSSIPLADQHLTIEYKDKLFSCGNLMFLTGTTKDTQPWQGWDLEPYNLSAPPINFSPTIDPNVTSPNFDLGGMLIFNPTIGEVEVTILVMN